MRHNFNLPSAGESGYDFSTHKTGTPINMSKSTILEVNSAEYTERSILESQFLRTITKSISPQSSAGMRNVPVRKSMSNSSGCYSAFRKAPLSESTFKRDNPESNSSESVSLSSDQLLHTYNIDNTIRQGEVKKMMSQR